MPEETPSPSWLSLATGYRSQISLALGIVFETMQAFDVFPLTARQQSAITALFGLAAGYFAVLKLKRMHASIAAVAQTGASTAEAVGAVVAPDPSPAAPPAPVAPLALLALLLLPMLGCATQPITTRWSYCRDAAHQGWCSPQCGRQQPAWCGKWTPVSPPGELFCWYRLRDRSLVFAACPVVATPASGI